MAAAREEKTCKAHVLVLPFPMQGHINPMLQFSKRLAFKGLKVTLANTIYISKKSHMHAEHGSVTIETFSDGCDNGGTKESGSFEAYQERFETIGSDSLQELIKKTNSSKHPFTCLIYDSVIPWGLNLSKKLGLIGVSFFTQSCSVGAIYYSVYRGLLSMPIERTSVSIPGLPLLEIHDLPSFVSDQDSYPAFSSFGLNQFSNIGEADWILFNTFTELENEVVIWMTKQWPMRTIMVRPTVPSMYLDKRLEGDKDYGLNLFKPNLEICMKWLNTKEPTSVVFVSFGSIASLGEDQMAELAWGLRRSNKYFLWVVRESEENKLPSNFREETMEKGLVVTWCTQLEVLDHRAIGCFITHCGWNSTLEALSLGVPIIAVPQWTDQKTNAKFIADVWKIGVMVAREEIDICIRDVMEEGERRDAIRMNAVRCKELARQAVGKGGSSDQNIEDFVAAVISKKSKTMQQRKGDQSTCAIELDNWTQSNRSNKPNQTNKKIEITTINQVK